MVFVREGNDYYRLQLLSTAAVKVGSLSPLRNWASYSGAGLIQTLPQPENLGCSLYGVDIMAKTPKTQSQNHSTSFFLIILIF